MELPLDFLQEMKQLLQQEYQDYLESFQQPQIYGLRFNRRKVSAQQQKQLAALEWEPIPWIDNGYYYPETQRPAKHPYYYAGLYYLQEPSAMTPASLLPIEQGDFVLDVCAAPGGKSTELGARLQGTGMLFANDLSNSRAKALLKNLELFGLANICVTSETPERLAEQLPGFFDKILVDAPCSGEGMFRKDKDMIKSWNEKGPDYYVPVQKEILAASVRMLKPGGYLLYSTCTFSVKEDEQVIQTLLESEPELELVPIPLWEGAADGIGLSGCVRLFPHKIKGEGHFISLIRKKGRIGDSVRHQNGLKGWKPAEAFKQFLAMFPYTVNEHQLMLVRDQVYALPEGFPHRTKLRFLRTGLWLGTMKNDRFEPSQALAMVLDQKACRNCLILSVSDERVIRYLKGETLQLTEAEMLADGWCLVCVEEFPLGFGKIQRRQVKNKYYPGWRWQ